jgi:hypothetical protein
MLKPYRNYWFRRQFLIAPCQCNSFNHWQFHRFDGFYLYVHPEVELTSIESPDRNLKVALIGYTLDPSRLEFSNFDILQDLVSSTNSIESISQYLHRLSGRFVLVVSHYNDTFIFHDPCGLKTVYYTQFSGQVYIGSQPLIFKDIIPLNKNSNFDAYYNSEYKKQLEPWLPSSLSLYKNVFHLVPNHYLQLSDLTQKRYWPTRRLQPKQLEDAVIEASELLERLIKVASKRFTLSLPLTSGIDSRTLLSACRDIAPDLYFYTLQYRDLHFESSDIKIPRQLLHSLGYQHHVIDCRRVADPEFSDIYENNASMAHEDWRNIAYGMIHNYPADRVSLKGNCSEICSCSYYKSGKHSPISSVEQILKLEPEWITLPFIYNTLSSWLSEANQVEARTGVDILDLFYWEHRMGSWQAQSQLEWDIVQESYTPFNHRGLIEIMLGVPTKFRREPDYELYIRMNEFLYPETLKYPINPPDTPKEMFKIAFKKTLSRLGLMRPARNILRNWRKTKYIKKKSKLV